MKIIEIIFVPVFTQSIIYKSSVIESILTKWVLLFFK
jgi:hypothetical protein